MKLNYKNTIKVGIAFAIIMLFWNAYDFVVPLLLNNVYGLPDDIRGLIMGLDNLLSLFLLPLFGKLSDNTKSKWGKRTPYIIIGTVLAACLMIFIPLTARIQMPKSEETRAKVVKTIDVNVLSGFYNDAKDGKSSKYCDYEYLESNKVTKNQYLNYYINNTKKVEKDGVVTYTHTDLVGEKAGQIVEINETQYKAYLNNYKKYVKAGVNTYIADTIYKQVTLLQPLSLTLYMILLFFVLVSMAIFRSPAVALMPDVTPKPLRSQGNAMINLVGGAGALLSLMIYTVWFKINKDAFLQIYITLAVGMIVLLLVFLKLVNEKKLVAECHEISKANGILDDDEIAAENEGVKPKVKMEKAKKISFLLILSSIFMWFMGYNAVTSNMSVYTTRNLLFEPSSAAMITAIAMVISAIAFIPVGYMATKVGRKKSVLLGFVMASIAFLCIALFVRSNWTKYLFVVFFLTAGFGLVFTNVNTFPMVVELSKESDVGKFTGYYYTATMSAQAITPYIAGKFMKIDPKLLFVYAFACIVIATVLMVFVKHGDGKMKKQSAMEVMGSVED